MKAAFHLFLIVCLLTNYSLPAAWAQTVSTRGPTNWAAKITEKEKEISQLRQKLKTEKDPHKIVQYRQQIESTMRQKAGYEKQLKNGQELTKLQPLPQDHTLVKNINAQLRIGQPAPNNYDAFLTKVRKDEVSFAELADYADPLLSDTTAKKDLRTIIFASEMIGNTLEYVSDQTPLAIQDEILKALAEIQPRLIFQLHALEQQYFTASNGQTVNTHAPFEAIMAIGTLRITLLKIHQFYQRMALENPVKFTPKKLQFQKPIHDTNSLSLKTPPLGSPMSNSPTDPTASATSVGLPSEKNTTDPYARIWLKFKNELATYLAIHKADLEQQQETWSLLYVKNPDVATHYNNGQLLTEYAALYAVLYGGNAVEELVQLFDTGSHRNGANGPVVWKDYKTAGAPFLNTVFTTLFETVRYSPIAEPAAKRVIAQLNDFSDKTKHDLPTVIFALEAASLLFKPHNQDYSSAQYSSVQQQEINRLTDNFNSFFKADPQTRALFASRVAEIYCTLKKTNHPEFGLDSSEMEQLANKLADMYSNFYDLKSPTLAMPGANTHPHPETACEITLRDNLNVRARNQEDATEVLIFARDCIFWTYLGGPLFSALGNAYRMTRGALAVLPKAARAFNAAKMGNKMSTFKTVIANGAKGSNLLKTARANNIIIGRTVPKKAPAKTSTLIPAGGPQVSGDLAIADARATGEAFVMPDSPVSSLTVDFKPIKSVRELTQERSRWLGRKLDPHENVFAIQTLPDGGTNILKLRDPHFFRFKPFDEITLDAFEPVTGSGALQSLSSAEARLAQERYMLSHALSKNPPFDGYVPLKTPLSAVEGANPLQEIRWWNLAWGKPENIAWDVMNQPIILAPRGAFAKAANPFQLRTVEELLAKGGFETSAMDVKTGAWANQAVNTYFQQMDYGQNVLAQYLLPRFTLNETGITALKNSGTVRWAVAKTIFMRPLLLTTAVLGGLRAFDYGLYPLSQGYLSTLLKTDLAAEKAKYPALDNALLKQDELYRQINNGFRDDRKIDTYLSVMASSNPHIIGTSVTFPIIAAKRGLSNLGIGEFSTLNESTKRQLARKADTIPFHRALRARKEEQRRKQDEFIQNIHTQQEADLAEQLQQNNQQFLQQDWVIALQDYDPASYKQLQNLLHTHRNILLAIHADKSLTVEQKKEKIKAQFDKINPLLENLEQKANQLIVEQNAQLILQQPWAYVLQTYDKEAYQQLQETLAEYTQTMKKINTNKKLSDAEKYEASRVQFEKTNTALKLLKQQANQISKEQPIAPLLFDAMLPDVADETSGENDSSSPEQNCLQQWKVFTENYKEAFLAENVLFKNYPALLAQVDEAFRVYVQAQEATCGDLSGNAHETSLKNDRILGQRLEELKKQLRKQEELLGDPTH